MRLRRDPADVGRARERARQRRLLGLRRRRRARLAWWATRYALGEPPSLPTLPVRRPDLPDGGHLLPRPDRGHGRHLGGGRPLAAHDGAAGADRRPARRRQGPGAGQGGRDQVARPVPRRPHLPPRDGRHAAARPAVRGRPGHRQDAHGQGDGRRGRRAVPVRLRHLVPVDVLRRHRAQDPLLLQGPAQGRPQGGRRDRLHRGDRRDRHRPRRDERLGRAAAALVRRVVDDLLRRAGRPARCHLDHRSPGCTPRCTPRAAPW